jgi:CheY-like chemotaxis protein
MHGRACDAFGGREVANELNGYTILVADDERYVVATISLKLRQAGATVITASDGCEAYELACAHLPDLICSDYQMPLLSGLDLAERLSMTARTSHIPVLMLTTRAHRIMPTQLENTNIRALLPKPFSARELLAKLLDVANEARIAA